MLSSIALFVVFGATGLAVLGVFNPKLARKILDMIDRFFNMVIEVCEWIGKTAQNIFANMGKGFTWLTSYPGNLLFLGFGVVYAWFLNAEGYWQIIPSTYEKLAFVPKPFIWDNANLENIGVAFSDINFWIAFALSTLIQVVQALFIRDAGIEQKRKQFEEANAVKVPEPDPKAIALAQMYSKQIRNHGRKAILMKGLLIGVAYLIDGWANYSNFPFLEVGAREFVFNLAWFVIGVLGAELFVNLFDSAVKNGKGKA